jgi:tetratricopeptide (TPR) repeat protein
MPLPQPITGEITHQLNAIKDASQLDQMAVQRLKNSIEKVKSVDLAQYYMLYGMYFSLFGDVDSSIEFHEKSIKQLLHPVMLTNYGFSVKRFGLGQKSFELMRRAFTVDPAEENFEVTIGAAINGGIFDDVDEVIEKYSKLHPADKVRERPDVRYLNLIRESLKRVDIPESDYKEAFKLAEQVLASFNYMVTVVNVDTSVFDKVPYLSVEIAAPFESGKEIANIQDGIAQAMVESDIATWDRIIFTLAVIEENQVA